MSRNKQVLATASGVLIAFLLGTWFGHQLGRQKEVEATKNGKPQGPAAESQPVQKDQEEDVPKRDYELAKQFRAEAKKFPDPVALALPLLQRKYKLSAEVAMDILVEHWNDPRAEKALKRFSGELSHGPAVHPDVPSLAREASNRVDLLRAKKEQGRLLKGADTAGAKMAKIRALFAGNPNWLDEEKASADEHALVRLLVDTALASAGPEAMDLIVQYDLLGMIGDKEAQRHADAICEFARQKGPEKVLANRQLFATLCYTRSAKVAELLEDWVKHEKAEKNLERLIHALTGADAQTRLIRLLDDSRGPVVKMAADSLRSSFPDATSLKALKQTLQARKAAGSQPTELDFLLTTIQEIEQEISTKKGKDQP